MSWSKENALSELQGTIDCLTALQGDYEAPIQEYMRCIDIAKLLLASIFGNDSRYSRMFDTPWTIRQLGSAREIIVAARSELEQTDLISVFQDHEQSLLRNVIELAEHKLRRAISTPPEREEDVQKTFEHILLGANIPYSSGVNELRYSLKTYRPDLLVPGAKLAVEFKLLKERRRRKSIIAQINDDIIAYLTKYLNVIFVVYDLGYISNIDSFVCSFESERVSVLVVKH